MVEYKTIKTETVNFGKNNFIEIARKKAVTDQGETEFISLARGFMTNDNQKRFKQSVTIPNSKDVVEFISSKLKEML